MALTRSSTREAGFPTCSDAELCDVYGPFLTERGWEVETSSAGLDCLSELRQVTPAALVLDLGLY